MEKASNYMSIVASNFPSM